MALHQDIDPLPKGEIKKSKYFTNPNSKIKTIVQGVYSYLANAIFLLRKYLYRSDRIFAERCYLCKNLLQSFISNLRPHLAHLSIVAVAVIAIMSNLIVRYARADYTVSFPDPSQEISFAATADNYTPLIPKDGISAESAYENSGGAFVALNASIDTNLTQRAEPLPDNSEATIQYTVKPGDTLTTLGRSFEVKLATLMYVNDIDNADLVKPGQQLKIPPRGYEVSASLIAKKQKERQLASARNTVTRNSTKNRVTGRATAVSRAAGSSSNGYPYGYCTYYVATRRYVPANWGNAKAWLSSAQRAGYSTGSEPVPGAIGVTPESWWGHVVYVESVDGDQVTFSEMNAVGWGKKSTRTMSTSKFRGFIY